MKLHEIIERNDSILNGSGEYHGISFEEMQKYRRSLITYYAAQWPRCEILFVATFLTNSICAGVLAPSTDLSDVFAVLTADVENEEDKETELERLAYQTQSF